jgi:carboxymethylenebutenolidase
MMRRALKILSWVGGALVALIVLAALSIPADGLLGSGRIDAVANVRIANAAGPEVRAVVARPSTPGPHPAVIMIHEWWGLNPAIAGMAEALAAEGYVVVAPDVFRGSTTGWIPRAIYQVSATPADQINADLDAVYTWLAQQPDVLPGKIGIVGFCFGGRTSLRYSLHNPSGIAATGIFYGMATSDPAELRALRGPVLGVFGGADASIPIDDVRALEQGLLQAGVESTVTVYADQPHAFVSDAAAISRPGAAQDAWRQLVGFLGKNLQGAAAGGEIPLSAVPAWWVYGRADTPAGRLHHALVCGLRV